MANASDKKADSDNTDIVDLEQYAKDGKNPPKAKQYRVRIDDKHYIFDQSSATGREILLKAAKNPPESFILTEKIRGGGMKTIGLNDVVDFTTPGIERFNTLPREVTEG